MNSFSIRLPAKNLARGMACTPCMFGSVSDCALSDKGIIIIKKKNEDGNAMSRSSILARENGLTAKETERLAAVEAACTKDEIEPMLHEELKNIIAYRKYIEVNHPKIAPSDVAKIRAKGRRLGKHYPIES